MTLKTQFVLLSALLVASVLSLGAFAVDSLSAAARATAASAAEHDAADRAASAAAKVAWMRDSLRGVEPQTSDDAQYFASLRAELADLASGLRQAADVDDGDAAAELQLRRSMAEQLDAAARLAGAAGDGGNAPAAVKPDRKRAADEMERLRQTLAAVPKTTADAARRHAVAAASRASNRLGWAYALVAVVVVVCLVVCARQYRTLVRPLLWLRDEMRRGAAREFREPVVARGPREFADVAGYFNGLARDLADLYRDLEQRVIDRSRELVRSERLASVGFLAAGVAHEINNPLSVISGYAELAGKGLRRVMLGERDEDDDASDEEAEAAALADALDAQSVIRDEAFRCKEITGRLLSLARGGTDERVPLRLDDVARQVAVLTRGLRNYRDRQVEVAPAPPEPLEVVANQTEMKQVLLNLTVNALEAVPPGRGKVTIAARRAGEWVEVSVEDNGKGMSGETLQQVFEPFFTAKRGTGEPGTGLGLSITHAIVENHGGRIRAESDGPGRGSKFVVRLPARPRTSSDLAASPVAAAGAN